MKAVSPLVATAILLVVTVAGGILIYNYVINSLSAAQHYASLSVVSARMLVMENSTIVNVKVSNIGTKSAIVTKMIVVPVNVTESVSVEVEPGVTKSINVSIGRKLPLTEKQYVILVYDSGETEPYPITVIR